MLKTVGILGLFAVLATAALVPLETTPVETQPVATTAYQFGYNDGQSTRSESRDASGNVLGSFSYIGPDGVVRTTHYTAGADGYKVLAAPQLTPITGETTPLATTANAASATTTTSQDTSGSTGLQYDTTYVAGALTPIYGTPTILVAAEEQPPTVYQTPTTAQQGTYQAPATTAQHTTYQVPAAAATTTTVQQSAYQPQPTSSQFTGYWPSPVVPPSTTTSQTVKVAPPVTVPSTGYQSSSAVQYAGGSPVTVAAVSPYTSYPGFQLTPAATPTTTGQLTGYQYPTSQYSGYRVVPVAPNYVYRYV